MKRLVALFILAFIFSALSLAAEDKKQQPQQVPAVQTQQTKADKVVELINEGDELYRKGGDVYCVVPNCLDIWKQSIEKYKEVLKLDPKNYDAWWKLARVYRQYGDEVQMRNRLAGKPWKDETDKYAKLGMAAAKKATQINPGRVEGWLMYGLCVGLHSDAVSVFTALKEGLKGKTQDALKKAYNMDKDFDDGSPILAWGRFWTVLPWPLRKLSKGIKILREGIETHGNGKWGTGGTYIFQKFLAEALIKDGGRKNREEAKKLLEEIVAKCPVKWYVHQSKEMLKDLE